jgi:hypothetical protein
VLLRSTDAGTPAFEALRDLARRRLPDVEALIERAEAMRGWLVTATDCSCTTLDACALFDGPAGALPALRITQVAPVDAYQSK